MSNNQRLVYADTNLIGALVRFEPAFQHNCTRVLAGVEPYINMLGAIGTVIEGEWTSARRCSGMIDGKDYSFRNILWYEFGYSQQTEWLTQTIRVISLAGGVEDGTRR